MTIYNVMGWGKGKTTSAIGIAARALMNNEIVVFCQFLKNDGDIGIDALIDISEGGIYGRCYHLVQATEGFKNEDCTTFFNNCLALINKVEPSLVVFDELNVALDYGLFTKSSEEIIKQVKEVAEKSDVYITGRVNNYKLRHQMIDIADIATNCYCEAHNFNSSCKKCGKEFNPYYKYCPICGDKLRTSKIAQRGREC